jgi:hypothetical protein
MNATTTHGVSAEQYLHRVRAALADLPHDEREELLEDLPAHLADVAAESGPDLEERLGSPEEYAAELRSSAGIAPAARTGGVGRRFAQYGAAMEQWPAWQRFRGFAPQLRPGWWVLRGYLVALLAAAIFADIDRYGLSVVPGGDLVIFIPFAAAVIWASVWLGKRSAGQRGWRRGAVCAFNTVVVIGALALSFGTSGQHDDAAYYKPIHSPFNSATDVYVYDREGRPLDDVRLFDQWGNPIELPGQPLVRERADGSGVVTNVYPRRFEDGASPPPSVPPLLPRPPVDGTPSPGTSPSAPSSPSPTP